MRFVGRVTYRGARYHGWQIQRDAATVQGELERALARMVGHPVPIVGASRTDAGVHARGQVFAFDHEGRYDARALLRGINALTADDIAVVQLEETVPTFHPRHDSRSKRYTYRFDDREVACPFDLWRSMSISTRLDVDAMASAAQYLLGEHDFASFRASGCDAKTTIRRLSVVDVRRTLGGLVEIDITGTAFLKYMVRTIAGTLCEVGLGRRDPAWVQEVVSLRDRRAAGRTAQARGLILERVYYEGDEGAL